MTEQAIHAPRFSLNRPAEAGRNHGDESPPTPFHSEDERVPGEPAARKRIEPTETSVVRAVARQVRHLPRPIESLMSWIVDRRNIDSAWERVSSNGGANTPGPDGVSCGDLARRLNSWLSQLTDELRRGEFRPRPPRWIDIPKSSTPDAFRRIGVLTVADRVVHQAIKQVLEPVLEPAFADDSFGFRPGRSVPAALLAATRALSFPVAETAPFTVAVKLDVADCFPSIDHQELLGELARHVADRELLQLIGRLCDTGGETIKTWWTTRRTGIVQGSGLSPLLCNLFLNRLDESVAAWTRTSGRAVRLLRYADDLLLLAENAGTARAAGRVVRDAARDLKLTLRESKTELRPVREGFRWLGVCVRPRAGTWSGHVEYGYDIPDDKAASMLAALDEMTRPPCDRIAADAMRLSRWLVSINDQLRQWREAYVFADNAPRVFAALDEQARDCVRRLLRHVTKLRGRALEAAHRIRLPRGFWTWEAEDVRLVNLSSLAPRAPFGLIRQPHWSQG